MPEKSFYDLDYIIEINEKRLEQYNNAIDKLMGRFTIPILIYSAITVFLMPIVQDIFIIHLVPWFPYCCFFVFAILFLISLMFTIRLIIPKNIAYLKAPDRYYQNYRQEYEETITDPEEIKRLLKASYINELEMTLTNNESVFAKKNAFYFRALTYVLLSILPYLVCIVFHISQKDDKVQKVQLVSIKK